MTDKKNTQDGGEQPNPSKEQTASAPEQKPEPQNEKGASADQASYDAKLKELSEKLDRYKEQVKGSSEEALRLKDENQKLKEKLDKMEESGVSNNNDNFQRIVEEHGLQAAVDWAVGKEIASLKQRIDIFEKKESQNVFEKFKQTHKRLENPEVLKAFDAEFEKLKDVYGDVNEALEKAYKLVSTNDDATTKPEQQNEVPQKDANEEKVVKNAVGGDEDSRPVQPTQQTSELQKQINDLQYEALTLQSQGRIRQAAEVLSRVEDLKARLGEKV